MPPLIGFYLAALAAGIAFVFQQTVNAGLRGSLGSGLWAGLTNFAVGGTAIGLVILMLREPVPTVEAVARAPWYAWLGGLLGALYIVGAVFIAPRIGAAALVALIVVGQMLTALAFDHFGILGIPVHAVSWARLAGAALLIAGAALVCLS